MEFKNLSDWIMVGYCATRVIKGGNPMNVDHRVAFIEKTPRVKLNNHLRAIDERLSLVSFSTPGGGAGLLELALGNSSSIWIEGPKGSSDYGADEESRK